MNRLLEIVFEKVGYWETASDKISFTLTRMASRENILYAFICDITLLLSANEPVTGLYAQMEV